MTGSTPIVSPTRIRDAALPDRRVSRDPRLVRARSQRRRARGVRGRAAQVPRSERRAAGSDLSTLTPVYVRNTDAGPAASEVEWCASCSV